MTLNRLPAGGWARRRPSTMAAWTIGAVLVTGLFGCGPGSDGTPAPGSGDAATRAQFQFSRTTNALLRLDSASGQMWLVPLGGEGGWTPLGDAPGPAGQPNANGRYRIYSLETKRRGLDDQPTPTLLRLDGMTGRTWTIEVLDGAQWVAVDEPAMEEPGLAESEPSPAGGAPTATAPRTGAEAGGAPIALGVVSREVLEADPAAADEFAHNLVEALEKEGMPPEVQAWSARQLAQFPREVAVPPLLAALQSEHPVVVVAAIHALRIAGDPSTIPAIQQLADHPDPSVRAAVEEVVVEVR